MGQEAAQVIREFRGSVMKLVIWIAIYIIIGAIVNSYLLPLLDRAGLGASQYAPYINIALALFLGYMIIRALANTIYWSLRARYDHPQAAAVRSIITIVGIGALLASIAGGVAGGAAGVALGGFLGIVVGFASQHVLGQAVAGLFMLLARPVRIGDTVTIAGETGRVDDISPLFVVIKKDDGTTVLVPNNMAIGAKIYILKRYGEAEA